MSIKWPVALERAAEIVNSYNTAVTLRQLFYRLVVAGLIPNNQNAYVTLSARTAAARREGDFPALIDQTREIHRLDGFDGPQDAVEYLQRIYRRKHDENQEYAVYLGVEKKTLVQQLKSWFNKYGVAIVPLGGYSSQSYVDEIINDVYDDGRPAIFLYAGDFDPSGVDILRDFEERCDCFDEVIRIALNEEQIRAHDLPVYAGKRSDRRAAGFIRNYGQLVQVELEALAPDVLREIYEAAFFEFYNTSIFQDVLHQERTDMERLLEFTNGAEL